MDEIYSYQVYLNQSLPTKEIIKIHQLTVESNYDIYLYQDKAIADASNLPKLISFFFMRNKENTIRLIIDGKDAPTCYKKIMGILNKYIEAQLRTEHKSYKNQSVIV